MIDKEIVSKNDFKQRYFNIEEGGAILEDNPDDFLLSGENQFFIKERNPFKVLYQYDQKHYPHNRSCTLYSTLGCIAYNTGLEIKEDLVEKLSQEAINNKLIIPGKGASIPVIVKWVTKKIEQIFNTRLIFLKVDLLDNVFYKALDNGWEFIVGYHTSSQFLKDYEEDGVLQGCEFPLGTGHAVRIHKENGKLVIVNSYVRHRKHNIFKIEQLKCMVKSKVFFRFGRIVLYNKLNFDWQRDISDIKWALENGITYDKIVLDKIQKGNYDWKVQTVLMITRAFKKLNKQ